MTLHIFLQIINHVINVEDMRHSDQKKTSCYDIDVEVDDTLKTQMNSFLLSTASQQVKIIHKLRNVFGLHLTPLANWSWWPSG